MMLFGYGSFICRKKQLFSEGRESIRLNVPALMLIFSNYGSKTVFNCCYRILGRGQLQNIKYDLGVQGMNGLGKWEVYVHSQHNPLELFL